MRSLASRTHLSAIILFLVLPTLLLPPNLTYAQQRPAQKKMNVAVLDFDARAGISKDEAASLSDGLTERLVASQEFTVVDRNRIKQLLMEQGFQRSEACVQTECIVEVGKILKVERIFVGTVGRVGSTYSINIQMVDVATAQITLQKSQQHSGKVDELLTDVVPDMANQIMEELTGKKFARSGGSNIWWYVGSAVVIGGGAAAYLLLKPSGNTSTGATEETLPKPPTLQ